MHSAPTDADPAQQGLRRERLRRAAEEQIRAEIPLSRFMDIGIAAWDGRRLRMRAPLAPNINDKGCAFGGSLVSAMTLACWSLIKLAADERECPCDIYVQDSSAHYRKPLWEDFCAEAELVGNESFDAFFRVLEARGRARIATRAEIRLGDGNVACSLEARFVALRRSAMAGESDAAQWDSVSRP